MTALVRYQSVVADNARWDGFAFRDGDIIVSTPPKCGTTWTQTILALLIFQTTEFDRPMDLISPWLDQTLRPLDSTIADLEAQTHRRFIKTHTPLDGLPFDERVTYITVARDPRDVYRSWHHHMSNINFDRFFELRDKAVGNEDLAELMQSGAPPLIPGSAPENELFWTWVSGETNGSVSGLESTLRHIETFWVERDKPNVLLLHYGDLKADLEGQMRTLAARLEIDVSENLWPCLVQAATFEEMKKRAKDTAPNATEPIWHDTTSFFNRGTNGQWRELLTDDDLRRYAERVNAIVDPELSHWIHQGPIAPLEEMRSAGGPGGAAPPIS